jgi:hypothetical protein
LCPDSLSADNDAKLLIKAGGFDETCENDASLSSQLPKKRSSFPPSAQAFIVAIKKNRALQRFLRSKLIETEAKIEENKKQRDKVKILKDFQVTLSRRTAKAFSLKIDPRVQLISSKKSVASNKSKVSIMLLWFCVLWSELLFILTDIYSLRFHGHCLKFKYLFIYDVCHMTEAYCCGFSFV